MDTANLHLIPSEVFRHLSFYLLEPDVEALSETCVYIYNALNDDSVWKRFLSKPARSLALQHQQLDPPLEPDPDLCQDHQLTLMKNHLISNWRNQKCVQYVTKIDYQYTSGVFNKSKGNGPIIYKENYLFLGRFTDDIYSDAIEIWDIRTEPVLIYALPLLTGNNQYECFFVFDEALVVLTCSRADVYQINVEKKEFPLLYSFIINDDEVVWSKPAFHGSSHEENCSGWSHYRVENYLVCNKCDNEPYYPVLHVWDISNACKVGAFVSPMIGFSISVLSTYENGDWLVSQSRQSEPKGYYFKLNIKSGNYSDVLFEYEGGYMSHLLIYKDHLIVFLEADDPDSEGWHDSVLEVYDINASAKIRERRFDNAHKNYNISSTNVADGKFILLCKGSIAVVDALSLEIVNSIPYESDTLSFVTHQINVYGQIFAVISEKDDSDYVWDIEKKMKLPTPLKKHYQLYINESRTKFVTLSFFKMRVKNFW